MANKKPENRKSERRSASPSDSGSVNSKKAKVSTRAKKWTFAQIVSAVRKTSEINRRSNNRPNRTDKGMEILAQAVAKSYTFPTLTKEGIGMSKPEAQARRDFAKRHKATLIEPSKVLGDSDTPRTENAIRIRLQTMEKAMGLPVGTFVAVRQTPSQRGSTEKSKVFVVRR